MSRNFCPVADDRYEFTAEEKRIPLSVARHDPRFHNFKTDKPARSSTLLRCGKDGRRSRGGKLFYLPLEKGTGGWLTSNEAIVWFFNKLDERSAPTPRSTNRQSELKRVDHELAALGVL